MEAKTRTIAKINDVRILLIENGDKFVPIKPICEALGIDVETQRKKIKEDSILASTAGLRAAVGADGKEREMTCLPHMFIFGWLFTINPKNVKPEAQEAVSCYKLECYKALYQHFTDQSTFLEEKQAELEQKMAELDKIRDDFKSAKDRLAKARKELDKVKEGTFDQWREKRAINRQTSMDF